MEEENEFGQEHNNQNEMPEMGTPEFNKMFLDQVLRGKSPFGVGGVMQGMLQQVLDQALEGEMAAYLKENKQGNPGNRRNGHKPKTVKGGFGEVEIAVPQAREQRDFEPQIVRKRQTVLADTLEDRIIGLYGLGMSLRDIRSHIREMYATEVSESVLSEVTDRVVPKVKEWQGRPLGKVYCIVWLDAMHLKVRDEATNKVEQRALYNVLAINPEGRKELLGCYLLNVESASFWNQVLTDLSNRGVEDVLIACTDNLKGFSEAIGAHFPKAEVQTCVVHQIRNSLKYIPSKQQKPFLKELKKVYGADTKELAELALDELEKRYGVDYPVVIKSWRDNWHKLSTYFAYAKPIRKLIYTTNPIEGFHRQLRKVLKTKGSFTGKDALMKLVYLAVQNIEKKWTSPLQNWGQTAQQLRLVFGERMPLDI